MFEFFVPTSKNLDTFYNSLEKFSETFWVSSPISYSWRGGCLMAKSDVFEEMLVTREKYNEYGHNICYEKFDV